MRRFLLFYLTLLWPGLAWAHVGSPDVYYRGLAGPYAVQVAIHVPEVVPGRAEITVQVDGENSVRVTVNPIAASTAGSNAPPPEATVAVVGQSNLFQGELWLMTSGAYSIDVRVHGAQGDGGVLIPVNSVATRQLPLPRSLAMVLLGLGAILFCSGIAMVAAAAGESIVPPGLNMGLGERRRYWIATATTAVVLILALRGGWNWWQSEQRDYSRHLANGAPVTLTSTMRMEKGERILSLTLSPVHSSEKAPFVLAPDHGKLLHVFLVSQPNHAVFAHLHPIAAGENMFDLPLPALPEGDYEIFCDLTLGSGFSATVTNTVHLPSAPALVEPGAAKADPDDSWTGGAQAAAKDQIGAPVICSLPSGMAVVWKAHSPLRAKAEAGLQFEVRDALGKPVQLESYMGMLSHAAVLRADGGVFTHLHPSGNYAMAAQIVFDNKRQRESGAGDPVRYNSQEAVCSPAGLAANGNGATLILPYQFPSAGVYRIWVQFKTGGIVQTAIFDTTVL